MTDSNISRGEFRNPCPDLKNPAANEIVDSLLSTVQSALKRFGEPTQDDYELASYCLKDIQEYLLRDRTMTLPELVEARIRLTVAASLKTHCLTAFPYNQALATAKRLQETIVDGGENTKPEEILNRYPLIGLVFSVKDCIHVEGFPTTIGCSSRAGKWEPASAEIVQEMRKMGAIMIAKTTAPQLMMSNTTHSPLWGMTRSPIQSADQADEQEFQVGGSSGGEAALVKMGGSQLGIGTDMGGSVRQPACLNELFGFKYTSKPENFRWKLPQDFMTGLPHTKVPATAPGFLARDLDTLKRVVDALDGVIHLTIGPEPSEAEDDSEEDEDDEEDEEDQQGWVQWPQWPQSEDEEEMTERLERKRKRDEREEQKEEERVERERVSCINPRIIYTTQQSSPEVQELIEWLVGVLQKSRLARESELRPSKCQELGDVDISSWAAAWMEQATQRGFDDARTMLADDPLIQRTMFDESRLSSTGSNREAWKPTPGRASGLLSTFLKQAGIRLGKPEKVILITPTYIMGGPVKNSSFEALDNAGGSEIWCQIFNLLDWPAITIPMQIPGAVLQRYREQALLSPEWAKHMSGLLEADPIVGDLDSGEKRYPRLSLQLVTVPGDHLALLDFAERISQKCVRECLKAYKHAQ
ncbi:related to amidase [Ustilago trichophora]|uniref:Related to amidase n=1 Tax=Ustilago trichophora TaxID=86804 RepID=A0A5C3ENE9_9BASI|nr:related to amidase [Ustilago trichophora]